MQKRRFVGVVTIVATVIVGASWWLTHRYISQRRGHHTVRVDQEALARLDNIVPVAIIGSGCAGLSSAVYGARAHFYTAVFEGKKPGGQLTTTSWVENWPGMGKELGTDIINRLRVQAKSFGARLLPETITAIDTSVWPYVLTTDEGVRIHALSVILATGASPKLLGVKGEQEFWGRGVTTCAICDAPFYKDADVVVVGGGDSAAEEALQIAPYAKRVIVLVRGLKMRASAAMQDRLREYAHIEVWYNTQISEIVGDDQHVHGVKIVRDGVAQDLAIDGVFLAIGHEPNTDFIREKIACDDQGYLVLADRTQRTSVPGIFAAGDVADHQYRQAGVAAGDGIKAALDAADFLREIGYNESVAQALQGKLYDPVVARERLDVQHIETVEQYETLLAQAGNKPVIFDFYTEYCPSCLQMMPVVEAVAWELQNKAVFVKVDALKARPLAEKLVVPTVPTMLVFKNGALVARTQDVMNRQQLLNLVEQYL